MYIVCPLFISIWAFSKEKKKRKKKDSVWCAGFSCKKDQNPVWVVVTVFPSHIYPTVSHHHGDAGEHHHQTCFYLMDRRIWVENRPVTLHLKIFCVIYRPLLRRGGPIPEPSSRKVVEGCLAGKRPWNKWKTCWHLLFSSGTIWCFLRGATRTNWGVKHLFKLYWRTYSSCD